MDWPIWSCGCYSCLRGRPSPTIDRTARGSHRSERGRHADTTKLTHSLLPILQLLIAPDLEASDRQRSLCEAIVVTWLERQLPPALG